MSIVLPNVSWLCNWDFLFIELPVWIFAHSLVTWGAVLFALVTSVVSDCSRPHSHQFCLLWCFTPIHLFCRNSIGLCAREIWNSPLNLVIFNADSAYPDCRIPRATQKHCNFRCNSSRINSRAIPPPSINLICPWLANILFARQKHRVADGSCFLDRWV